MSIDSHCHLADEVFVDDLPAVVERARHAGLTGALCILSADEPEEVARAGRVVDLWPDVQFAAGIHPHRAGTYAGRAEDAAQATRQALERTFGVAVGEIGLDYHYDFAPRDVQRDVFAAQIALALELERPVIIHTREAWPDTLDVLRSAGQGRLRGVMHCFSGTADEAREALDLGFFISLAGILTFPKAENVREMAQVVPLDRLLVETDAPFLAPVPHRGKRNEPAWVVETLRRLAALKAVGAGELAAQVRQNFDRFLGAAR
jgi:TatD DNase family protein